MRRIDGWKDIAKVLARHGTGEPLEGLRKDEVTEYGQVRRTGSELFAYSRDRTFMLPIPLDKLIAERIAPGADPAEPKEVKNHDV